MSPSVAPVRRSSSIDGRDDEQRVTADPALTPQSDTRHQHQRCLWLHSARGRLCYADRLAVTGTKFQDTDGNGLKDGGEGGLISGNLSTERRAASCSMPSC